MSDFRTLSDSVLASPQLTLADIDTARSLGVTMIVNNRPERESDDQMSGPTIESAARAAGLEYVAIPISPGQFSEPQVQAMIAAMDQADGKVLAYCRTGTRSTFLWALAQAADGQPLSAISEAAAAAGYDIAPIFPAMTALAERARR